MRCALGSSTAGAFRGCTWSTARDTDCVFRIARGVVSARVAHIWVPLRIDLPQTTVVRTWIVTPRARVSVTFSPRDSHRSGTTRGATATSFPVSCNLAHTQGVRGVRHGQYQEHEYGSEIFHRCGEIRMRKRQLCSLLGRARWC